MPVKCKKSETYGSEFRKNVSVRFHDPERAVNSLINPVNRARFRDLREVSSHLSQLFIDVETDEVNVEQVGTFKRAESGHFEIVEVDTGAITVERNKLVSQVSYQLL